ncbi:MAG: 3D domain-containing protein [Candidatus Pacebacteria bacterium]|nr:3D domain-containing protein [Candidatus Paceibacterota bacterium]
MGKNFCFSLAVIFTGIIFAPVGLSPCVQTEAKTISVIPMKKMALLKQPVFLFQKTVLATAYTSKPGDLTFSETKPSLGTIAVDPKRIPLGSTVYLPDIFPGQKFLAVDTGKKIKGWKIDIWMPSDDLALEWGKKKLRAIIKKPLAG